MGVVWIDTKFRFHSFHYQEIENILFSWYRFYKTNIFSHMWHRTANGYIAFLMSVPQQMIEILFIDICGLPMVQLYRKNEWNGHNKIFILIKMSSLGPAWGWPVRRLHCPAQIKPRLAESNFPPDWLGACGRVYHCDAPERLRGAATHHRSESCQTSDKALSPGLAISPLQQF